MIEDSPKMVKIYNRSFLVTPSKTTQKYIFNGDTRLTSLFGLLPMRFWENCTPH